MSPKHEELYQRVPAFGRLRTTVLGTVIRSKQVLLHQAIATRPQVDYLLVYDAGAVNSPNAVCHLDFHLSTPVFAPQLKFRTFPHPRKLPHLLSQCLERRANHSPDFCHLRLVLTGLNVTETELYTAHSLRLSLSTLH